MAPVYELVREVRSQVFFHLYQVVHVCSENVCHSSKQRLRTGKGVDSIFLGVADGFKGMKDSTTPEWIGKHIISAEFFYSSYHEATRRDVEKALRVRNAFEHLLDEAQS